MIAHHGNVESKPVEFQKAELDAPAVTETAKTLRLSAVFAEHGEQR